MYESANDEKAQKKFLEDAQKCVGADAAACMEKLGGVWVGSYNLYNSGVHHGAVGVVVNGQTQVYELRGWTKWDWGSRHSEVRVNTNSALYSIENYKWIRVGGAGSVASVIGATSSAFAKFHNSWYVPGDSNRYVSYLLNAGGIRPSIQDIYGFVMLAFGCSYGCTY